MAAMIGHNNGPPLDEQTAPASGERAYAWRRAHQRAWRRPSADVALLRARAADRIGVSYQDYEAILKDRGRAPTALFFELGGTLVRTRNGEIAEDRAGAITLMPGVREKFARLGECSIFVVTDQPAIGEGALSVRAVENYIQQVSDQTRRKITDHCICGAPRLSNSEMRKPAPGMIRHLLNKYLLQPAQGVMIGNTVADEQCAARAGLARFLWAWRYFAEPAPA
jgi:HAD superfamily hydrolase (TIGR01662 family)